MSELLRTSDEASRPGIGQEGYHPKAGDRVIAHVRRNEDGTWAEPQDLLDHLEGTASLAEKFAETFESGSWGRLLAHCHDLGKSTEAWQRYLGRKSGYDEFAHLESSPVQ